MRDTTAQDQAGYPGSVEWLYAWLRRHPWLIDGTLAVVVLAGAANAYLLNAAVLPASLALAGAVVVRRRFPVAAYATVLAVGAAQVAVGIGSKFTDSPLQPTFADVAILVLLYTVAAERPRRISLPALAACVVLFAAVVVRYNPGGNPAQPQPRHQVEFFLVTALLYLLAPVSAWVLGDSMGYRRAYAGASGFLLKSAPPEELLYAIRSVHHGDSVVAPSTTRRLIGRFLPHLPAAGVPDRAGLAELTAREREVLAEVGSGLSNAEIAALLHISEATVKTHVGHIMAKLGLRDRIQVVVYAYETGLIAPQGRRLRWRQA